MAELIVPILGKGMRLHHIALLLKSYMPIFSFVLPEPIR